MKKIFTLLCSLACLHLAAQNVGVGTTSPTQQLDVNGNLRVRGLANTAGQAASFMQVDADGVLGLAKPDTLRANPTPVAEGSAGTGNGAAADYPSAVAVSGARACVVNSKSYTIDLFDVSAATPVLLGSTTTNHGSTVASPCEVAIQGSKAYVLTQASGTSTLQTFDISGNTPVRLNLTPIGDDGWRLVVRNSKAYVTTVNNTLSVYDLTGNAPTLIGFVATGAGPRDFLLAGNKAYVLNSASNALQVFDITANTPVYLTTVTTDVQPYGIASNGLRLYVANRNAKSIEVFDIAGNVPVSISRTATGFLPEKIKMAGSRAYVVGNSNLLNVFDASGRLKPVLIGNVPFLDPVSTATALAITDRKAYVGTSDKKLQVFELGFSGSITALGPDGGLVVVPDAAIGGDNLGDHNVTQNLNLRNFSLVGNDGTSGIQISTTGNVGIGTETPHAPLQFSSGVQARKIVLAEDADNDHNFYGFGTDASSLRYQLGNAAASHVFSAAASSTTSTEIMRVTGSGRVGIGTANPAYKLDVAGNSQVRGDFIHTSADGGGTWVYLNNTNAVPVGWKLVTQASPSAGTGGNLLFYNSNNNAALTVQQNGYVGVGLTNPATLFTNTAKNILGGSGVGLGLGSMAWQTDAPGFVHGVYNQNTAYNANGLVVKIAATAASNRILDLVTGATQDAPGTSVLVVQGDGNVGIGTGSPAQKLDVQGNIAASGSFMMGTQYISTEVSLGGGLYTQLDCNCPVGTKAIGGGGGYSGNGGPQQVDVRVNFSGPLANGAGWRALVQNTGGAPRNVTVWAICARVQ